MVNKWSLGFASRPAVHQYEVHKNRLYVWVNGRVINVGDEATLPYLAQVSELIGFLNQKHLSENDLARHLSLRTFQAWGAFGIYISTVDSDGYVSNKATFGLDSARAESWQRYSLNLDVPSTDAIKENRTVWIADEQEWMRNYPHLGGFPSAGKLKTSINTPLKISSSPVGVLGILCGQVLSPNVENLAFLEIIAGLVSLNVCFEQEQQTKTSPQIYLTHRQSSILKLLALQMTNAEIGLQLGYSISTIRQETMRIYSLFEVANRREAVEFAHANNLLE